MTSRIRGFERWGNIVDADALSEQKKPQEDGPTVEDTAGHVTAEKETVCCARVSIPLGSHTTLPPVSHADRQKPDTPHPICGQSSQI